MTDLDITVTGMDDDPAAQSPGRGNQREAHLIPGSGIQSTSQVEVLMVDRDLMPLPDTSPPKTRGSLWAGPRHKVHPGRVSPLGDITLHPIGHHPNPDRHPGTDTGLIDLTRTVIAQVGGIQDPH